MREIIETLPEITAKISYIDTLQTWHSSPLSPDQLEALVAQCGKVSVFTETLRNRPDLRRRYLIQQPSIGAIEFLQREASFDHLVNRVDVALDLIVVDAMAAKQLDEFFLRHKVQRWHGQRRMALCNGTAYASRNRRTARNLVQYCDQPSKVTGLPCLHLEVDLPRLDHRKVWAKELCLRAIDPRRLEREIDKAAGRMTLRYPRAVETMRKSMGGDLTMREAASRRIKAHLCKLLGTDGGPEIDANQLHLAPAQRLVQVRPASAKRCLIPIPIDQFLPDGGADVTLIK
jgi:hypothetical protein